MLYFAYAANLNRSHMDRLCPGAEPLFPALLGNFTLTVRQWFNAEPLAGAAMLGGVWRIGEGDLCRLNEYEDCPALYERRVVPVERFLKRGKAAIGVSECGSVGERSKDHVTNDSLIRCVVYLMKEPFALSPAPPGPEYLEMVRQGYGEWEIPATQLDAALQKVSRL